MRFKGLGYGIGVKGWTVEEQRAKAQEENREMLAAMKRAYETGAASTGRDESVVLGAQGTGGLGIGGSLLIGGGSLTVKGGWSTTDTRIYLDGGGQWMQIPEVSMGAELGDYVFTDEDVQTLRRFAEAAPAGPAREWLYAMANKASVAAQPKVEPEPEPELPSVPMPSREVKPLDLELIKVG